jgi:hypothetical protein
MKSTLLSTIFFFAGAALFAQPLSVKMNNRQPSFQVRNGYSNQLTSTTDTVDIYIMRATGGTFYQSQDGGYIFGTSYYYDGSSGSFFPVTDETGLHYDGIGNATVTDILFWAGAKQITGSADDITGKIYSVGADSMPVTLLGSGTMSMTDVDTSLSAPAFTDLVINNGSANITSGFFVSLEYAGNDDTLGLVSTGAGDGMGEKRIRQKTSTAFGGVWNHLGDLYPLLDVDLFFAPIVSLSGVGINDHFTLKDATMNAVYPSVTASDFHLDYTLSKNSVVSYYLFDLKGKKYFQTFGEEQSAGTYSRTFDVTGLAAGNYFLSVNINGKTVSQKIVVTK